MRKSLMLIGIPFAVVGVAIAVAVGKKASDKKAPDAFAEELKRAEAAGLELAQAQGANKYALSEVVPQSKPEKGTTVKRGNGAQAVRSSAPTVKAAPTPVVADVVEEIPEMPVMQNAPAPTQTEATAPVPTPAPVTTYPMPEQDDGAILRGGTGRGTGSSGTGSSVMGVIFGSVIRGGGVDGDNCDLHRTSRTNGARTTTHIPVYAPNPNGMGGARTSGTRYETTTSRPTSSGGGATQASRPAAGTQARSRGGN